MKRSADMNTINQEETAAETYLINVIIPQTRDDDENGSKVYILRLCKVMNNNVVLSAIARTSRSIMKTDVFMREPYVITIMMRLFMIKAVMMMTMLMMMMAMMMMMMMTMMMARMVMIMLGVVL